MRGPKEFSGAMLRHVAQILADTDDADSAFEDATGLPASVLPRVRTALEVAGEQLPKVMRVRLHGVDELLGSGELIDGVEYVVDLLGSGAPSTPRRTKLPPLVTIVKKGERAPPPPKAETVRWPSSPPKHDLPVGRGHFSSGGKRESPRPGLVPAPLAEPPPAAPEEVVRARAAKRSAHAAGPGPEVERAPGGPRPAGFKPGFKRGPGGPRSEGGKPGFKRGPGGPKPAGFKPGFKRGPGGPRPEGGGKPEFRRGPGGPKPAGFKPGFKRGPGGPRAEGGKPEFRRGPGGPKPAGFKPGFKRGPGGPKPGGPRPGFKRGPGGPKREG